MKSVLIDASSAILLHKVGLFGAVSRAYRLRVTPAVFKEITVLRREGAGAFKKAYAAGSLSPADPGPDLIFRPMPSLGAGERETLMAFKAGRGAFVIIDDGKGAAACRSGLIPHINALLCPKLLLWAGAIDGRDSVAGFERLLQIGRYSASVIAYAKTCTPDMLSFFSPLDFQHKNMPDRTNPV